MMTETGPAYLATPAASQAYAALHRAAQDTLGGVTGGLLTVTLDDREPLPPDGGIGAATNVLVEVQFERPMGTHHGVVVLADAADLTRLFALAPPADDDDEILPAESLLTLGDIVSTFLDTLVGELTWLQPAPRAWLANLEPVTDGAADGADGLPAILSNGSPLYEATLTLAAAGGGECPVRVIFNEDMERALLGLDKADAAVVGDAGDVGDTGAEDEAAGEGAPPSPGEPVAAEAGEGVVGPARGATGKPSSSAAGRPAPSVAAPVQAAQFKPLGPEQTVGKSNSIDLIRDIPLHVSVELGRASLTVREILALGSGSVVELDRLAGEPVDVLVNDRLIARGEVVIVDESFGVRVIEIVRDAGRRGAQ